MAVATPSPLTTPNPLKKPFNGWLTPRIFIGVPHEVGALVRFQSAKLWSQRSALLTCEVKIGVPHEVGALVRGQADGACRKRRLVAVRS